MEEFEEFVKESFKKIIISLQKQESVISSMVRNYSLLLNPNKNQQLSSLSTFQEPIITPQKSDALPTHQELTSSSLHTHHHQEPSTIFQELPLLSTPTQNPKILPKDQLLLPSCFPITPNTFKNNSLNSTKTKNNIVEKITMFEGFKDLPSHRYCAFGTTMKKKVLAVNVRHYKHSYLQQDDLRKRDKEMLAAELIPHGRSILQQHYLLFSLENKAYLKRKGLIRGKISYCNSKQRLLNC